jgi:hypothetical protein
MVLPFSSTFRAPNPRPDRPFLEAVHAHLDARRPLATELYVVGCEYVPVGVATGITIRDGFGREAVLTAVREAIARWLWPLPPGGPQGTGWPLGRALRDRELEVAIAQVPGVNTLSGVRLFSAGTLTTLPPLSSTTEGAASTRYEVKPPSPAKQQPQTPSGAALLTPASTASSSWTALTNPISGMPVEIAFRPWQLPELMAVVVDADGGLPKDLRGAPDPYGTADTGNNTSGTGPVPVPVVPEVC